MAEEAPQEEPRTPSKKEPYGPGVLIIFGVVMLVVVGFCFKDVVYPATAAEEWRTQPGHAWYIPLNWVVMFAGAAAALYCFALAAVRSRRLKAGPPDSGTPG